MADCPTVNKGSKLGDFNQSISKQSGTALKRLCVIITQGTLFFMDSFEGCLFRILFQYKCRIVVKEVVKMGFLKRMKEDMDVVFEKDPAARTYFEVFLTYSGLHAIWNHRIAHFFYIRNYNLFAVPSLSLVAF